MTPKQSVLKKYPKAELVADCAICKSRSIEFWDYAVFKQKDKPGGFLGGGATPKEAWAHAWYRVIT